MHFVYNLTRNVTPMNEDSNLSVASDSQDGSHPVVINTLNGGTSNLSDHHFNNLSSTNGGDSSSVSNPITTNSSVNGGIPPTTTT